MCGTPGWRNPFVPTKVPTFSRPSVATKRSTRATAGSNSARERASPASRRVPDGGFGEDFRQNCPSASRPPDFVIFMQRVVRKHVTSRLWNRVRINGPDLAVYGDFPPKTIAGACPPRKVSAIIYARGQPYQQLEGRGVGRLQNPRWKSPITPGRYFWAPRPNSVRVSVAPHATCSPQATTVT